MALGLTQPLTEISNRNMSRGVNWLVRRNDNIATLMCRLSWNLGNLKLLEPSGPLQACNGISLIKYEDVNNSISYVENCYGNHISNLTEFRVYSASFPISEGANTKLGIQNYTTDLPSRNINAIRSYKISAADSRVNECWSPENKSKTCVSIRAVPSAMT